MGRGGGGNTQNGSFLAIVELILARGVFALFLNVQITVLGLVIIILSFKPIWDSNCHGQIVAFVCIFLSNICPFPKICKFSAILSFCNFLPVLPVLVMYRHFWPNLAISAILVILALLRNNSFLVQQPLSPNLGFYVMYFLKLLSVCQNLTKSQIYAHFKNMPFSKYAF